MTGTEQRQQIVDGGADLAQVGFDVREGGGADRDDDVIGAGGVGGAIGQFEAAGTLDPFEHLLGPGLIERHAARAQRVQDGWIMVDAEHPQTAVGEAQRQRQSDATEADHRYVSLLVHLPALVNVAAP